MGKRNVRDAAAVKRHTFKSMRGVSMPRGVITDDVVEGYADHREIYVSPELPDYRRLNRALHEAAHILLPDWSEARVRWLADELERFASRVMGFRK